LHVGRSVVEIVPVVGGILTWVYDGGKSRNSMRNELEGALSAMDRIALFCADFWSVVSS